MTQVVASTTTVSPRLLHRRGAIKLYFFLTNMMDFSNHIPWPALFTMERPRLVAERAMAAKTAFISLGRPIVAVSTGSALFLATAVLHHHVLVGKAWYSAMAALCSAADPCIRDRV